MRPLDHVVFASPNVHVGAFHCDVNDPRFRDSGPIQRHLVAFPRSAVWIRQAGSSRIVADARVATIYNAGQTYERGAVSPEGDRCDWFAVAPQHAEALGEGHCPVATRRDRSPFAFEFATVDRALHVAQRRVFLRLERGTMEALEAEESVLNLVGRVLEVAARDATASRAEPPIAARAQRDLIEAAKAELAGSLGRATDLTTVAARVGSSPYHLCRVFRRGTGMTMHEYRLDLRLRAALDRLAAPGVDLSHTAADLGFSSHSHFTSAFRARYGVTPSAIRRVLRAECA